MHRRRGSVVIGGGTGLSVMLRGLKDAALGYYGDRHGGRRRREFGHSPIGDANPAAGRYPQRTAWRLADVEPMLSEVLKYRFTIGHRLGRAQPGQSDLGRDEGDHRRFRHRRSELSKVLAVRGRVLPAARQADRADRRDTRTAATVRGESQIPKSGKTIKRVRIEPPDAVPLEEAVEAIGEADAIIIGPGSLYTSIIPNLLVPGIANCRRSFRGGQDLRMQCHDAARRDGSLQRERSCDRPSCEHVPGHGVRLHRREQRDRSRRRCWIDMRRKALFPFRSIWTSCSRPVRRSSPTSWFMFGTYLRHDTEKLSEQLLRIIHSWIAGKR